MSLISSEEHSRRMQAKAEVATKLLAQLGFTCEQKNGQRISINTSATKPAAQVEDTEVFICKLPRDLFEDELLPVMQQMGKVYRIRLMMDFSASNRGFAYVQYCTPASARSAIAKLNSIQFRQDQNPASAVVKSFDNKRLFFSQLPPEITEEVLLEALNSQLDGVTDVELLDPMQPGCPLSANVTFASHEAATQARRVLMPSPVEIMGRQVRVDWARPQSKSKHDSDSNNNSSQAHNRNTQRYPRRPTLAALPMRNLGGFINNRNNIANNMTRRLATGSTAQTPNTPSPLFPTPQMPMVPYGYILNQLGRHQQTSTSMHSPGSVLGPATEHLFKSTGQLQQIIDIFSNHVGADRPCE